MVVTPNLLVKPAGLLRLAILTIAATACSAANALTGTSDEVSLICDRVAAEAAQRTGVPISVLRAISLTETGRKRAGSFRPWPWTVNMEGKGFWFDTEDAARAYVYKEYKRGARSFDVGCFQINFKWHGEAFQSIDEMFDPLTNAVYAAKFLKTLYIETGSWGQAAGAYHSRTPEFANRYKARFERFRSALAEDDGRNIPTIPDIVLAAGGEDASYPDSNQAAGQNVIRVNRYPLLKTGGSSELGSLVPLTAVNRSDASHGNPDTAEIE